MKHLLPILLVLLILSACTPAQNSRSDSTGQSEPPMPSADHTPGPDDIVNNQDPLKPKTDDTVPRHGDEQLTRGPVFLDSVNLLTMESFPLQFSLSLAGNLPTPCHQLRVAVSPPDAENKIVLEVYSVFAADTACAEMLKGFTENVPLGSFPAGHYTVWINGEKAAEFDA